MLFCDLKCVHASAPKEDMDGSRSCMTFTAIWCELYKKHVMKSQPCAEKKDRDFGRKNKGKNVEPRK